MRQEANGESVFEKSRYLLGSAVAAICLLGTGTVHAEQGYDTSITLYDGIGVLEDITEYAIGSAELSPTEDRIAGIAAGHVLGWVTDSLSIEAETQAVYHYGRGNFAEFGATLVARWSGLELPNWLGGFRLFDGISIGVGPSLTTAIPPLEADRGRISHFMNQVMVEYLDPVSDDVDAQTLDRVHHRSGVFGLIEGIVGGSDYLGRGVRFVF